jgi:predicted amidohydrolase YtcJ
MSWQLLLAPVVHTMDAACPRAGGVLVRDGRIVMVGAADALAREAPAGTARVVLDHGALLPGFNDAHVHLWKVGDLLTRMLDVRGVESLAALERRLAERGARLAPGAWFLGRGYNEATMAEGRHPTRAELDRVFPDRPAWLVRTCAHIGVANSVALRLAGITRETAAPHGGEIDRGPDGEPTGLLRETAMGMVARMIPPPTGAELQAMIRAATAHQNALGITAATDPAVTPELTAAYQALAAEGALTLRANLAAIRRPDGGHETYDLPAPIEHPFLRLRTVKFFADGGLSGATAAMRDPYAHAPTRGVMRFDHDELLALARESQEAGFRLATHAIGDAAIDRVLDVYTELGAGRGHRIEHFGVVDETHLRRAWQLGIHIVSQPMFLRELGVNFRRYLPPAAWDRVYPYASMARWGLRLAFSSDAPVVGNDSPLAGIAVAATRADAAGTIHNAAERLHVADSLWAYTRGGAAASGHEGEFGVLRPGAHADMVWLAEDPLAVPAAAVEHIAVRRTWLGGRVVHGA